MSNRVLNFTKVELTAKKMHSFTSPPVRKTNRALDVIIIHVMKRAGGKKTGKEVTGMKRYRHEKGDGDVRGEEARWRQEGWTRSLNKSRNLLLLLRHVLSSSLLHFPRSHLPSFTPPLSTNKYKSAKAALCRPLAFHVFKDAYIRQYNENSPRARFISQLQSWSRGDRQL